MKICNIGYARTRTSLLTTKIVNYYKKIVDHDEYYRLAKDYTYVEQRKIQLSLDKDRTKLEIYKQHILNCTEKFFADESFVIKLWPIWFNATFDFTNSQLMITDLTNFFRIKDYDKIIVTTRNPVDALCSYDIARKYGYTSHNSARIKYKRELIQRRVKYNFFKFDQIHKSYLLEILVIKQILKYLNNNNIPYTHLDYKDVPNYVDINFPNPEEYIQPLPLEIGLDYKEVISNFNEVEDLVAKYTDEYQNFINNIEFL